MKETQVVSCVPMIQAILDGRKSEMTMLVKDDGDNCRYGGPGDRLWIKEAYLVNNGFAYYRAGGRISLEGIRVPDHAGWHSPYFMPRVMARIVLEILSVKKQRIQEITESECGREGVGESIPAFISQWNKKFENKKETHKWETNPSVWRISFRRLQSKENIGEQP